MLRVKIRLLFNKLYFFCVCNGVSRYWQKMNFLTVFLIYMTKPRTLHLKNTKLNLASKTFTIMKTPHFLKLLNSSLLPGESCSNCHMAFIILSNWHSTFLMPVWKAPWSTCKPHLSTFIIDSYSSCSLDSSSNLRTSKFTFDLFRGNCKRFYLWVLVLNSQGVHIMILH